MMIKPEHTASAGFPASPAWRNKPIVTITEQQPMIKRVHPVSIDRKSASTKVETVLQQHKLTRSNSEEPVEGLIFMTRNDKRRLLELLFVAQSFDFRGHAELNGLAMKLKHAYGVDAREVSPDIITMNSRAQLVDLKTGEIVTFAVVLPRDADIELGRISVLTPLGTAMLGHRVGDEFEWKVPYDLKRFRVTKIHYQPEAAGVYP